MSIMEITNLIYKINNNKILNDINLKLDSNKLYSIIGPNGSGKTTLLKTMLGLIKPNEGGVLLRDKNINKLTSLEKSRLMSYVPQNTQVEFSFKTDEIIMMGRNPYKGMFSTNTKEDRNMCNKAMELTNVVSLKDRNINTLSGGERQRVIIGRALCQDTDIIFLDEPISQLDIHHQIEIMKLLKDLVLYEGKTIIVVIHDLNLAASYSDEIILMNDGKIVDKGLSHKVMRKESLENIYPVKFHIVENPINKTPLILSYN